MTYGICAEADLYARDIEITENGVSFEMKLAGMHNMPVNLKMTGMFNVYNALLAAGMILFGRHVVALFISADAANAAEALSVAYDYLVVMSTFLLSAYVLHTYCSALQGMGFTTAPMLSGLTEFAGRVGASLLLTRVIGERGLFYTDAAAWTFAAVFLAASYYIQLLIIRKKGLTYQNTK